MPWFLFLPLLPETAVLAQMWFWKHLSETLAWKVLKNLWKTAFYSIVIVFVFMSFSHLT